jgi:hypothetical protein
VVEVSTPPPRFCLIPERVSSLGPASVAFAERVGIPLDEHQRLILDAMMGVDAEGGWTSPENCVIEPRQNGKTSCLIVRCLYGLFELGEKHILFAGNMWSATHEAFLLAADVVQSNPELADLCKVRYSASDLGFTLRDGGARLRFVTRSRQAARGAAGDLIIFDEAGWLDEATHNALLPTLSARSAGGKVQVFYAGTAVDQTRHPDGVVLASIRRRGIRGDDPRLCFLEWSAEVLDEDGNELPPDRVPDEVASDPKVQRGCNPAMGARIAESHVDWEFRALDRRGFATERLGVGDWPAEDGLGGGPIDVEQWRSLEDPDSQITGPIVVGFDVGPKQQSSICVAGRRDDGLVHLECTDHRLSTGELVERLQQHLNERETRTVIVDAFGVAGAVVTQLEERGVDVHRVSGAEHAEAVGVLMEEVTEETLRHLGSLELLDAVRGAKLRSMGDAHLWSRRHATVDISPLVAGSLAVWGARGMPEHDPDWWRIYY